MFAQKIATNKCSFGNKFKISTWVIKSSEIYCFSKLILINVPKRFSEYSKRILREVARENQAAKA